LIGGEIAFEGAGRVGLDVERGWSVTAGWLWHEGSRASAAATTATAET
jgi:hypothetical protein